MGFCVILINGLICVLDIEKKDEEKCNRFLERLTFWQPQEVGDFKSQNFRLSIKFD